MPDYWDGLVVGVCLTVVVLAGVIVVTLFWREILTGLRDLAGALADIFTALDRPVTPPRWVQQLRERIRR